MNIAEAIFLPLQHILPKLPVATFNLLVGIIFINIIMFAVRRAVRLLKIPHDLRGIVISLSNFVLWIMLTIFVASSLGLNNLAWALSGSALILVFFLNNSAGPLIANVVSGLFLIGDPDFTVGMKVITNDGKTEGVIKGIDMRKVRIQDTKGKLHVVPNSLVENTEWVILERKAK